MAALTQIGKIRFRVYLLATQTEGSTRSATSKEMNTRRTLNGPSNNYKAVNKMDGNKAAI